jgi:hypothetical protein
MAIPKTNVQGTKVYFVAQGTDVSTSAKIETALASAKAVGCVQSDIDTTISRNVNEYTCLSSDESTKSYGSISLPNFPMELIFDADNADGQAEIRAMFNDITSRTIIIELTDGEKPYATIASGEAYPTTITFDVGCSGMGEMLAKDSLVMQNATIEMESVPHKIYYAAGNVKA